MLSLVYLLIWCGDTLLTPLELWHSVLNFHWILTPRSGPPRPTPYATSSYLGSGALSKLPCTMQMSSSSHLGSDALKWTAVTAIHPLRCPSHSARGLHLFTFLRGSPLCLAQQATPTPLPPSCTEACFTQPHLMPCKFLILKFFPKCHSERLLPPM